MNAPSTGVKTAITLASTWPASRAVARSLSTTASTPTTHSTPRSSTCSSTAAVDVTVPSGEPAEHTFSTQTGMPPPPAATTTTPASSRVRTTAACCTACGGGEGTTRLQPESVSRITQPRSVRMRSAVAASMQPPTGLLGSRNSACCASTSTVVSTVATCVPALRPARRAGIAASSSRRALSSEKPMPPWLSATQACSGTGASAAC
mmetsp:Transcript_13656/g.41207  ORF Transcript_13656/g.41207 Transcript_13656/m.41207 type:complete len:206 (+) Transcript_13656:274-891(+)